jgi:hypothetical protein
MRTKDIDWSEPHEDVDFSCPFCGGEGFRKWEDLNEEERETVKVDCANYLVWEELSEKEKEKVKEQWIITDAEKCNDYKKWKDLDAYERDAIIKIHRKYGINGSIEEYYNNNRGEFKFFSDGILGDYYEGNAEDFKFFDEDAEDTAEEYYEDHKSDFEFYCEECDDGWLNPMYSEAYPLGYTDVNDENRRIALDCGLFLFEDDEGIWMSLMGCGMDLSPNILMAYRLLEGRIPFDYAMLWRQDYHAYISEEDHRLNAEECKRSIENELSGANEKLKAINLFLKDPEYVKEKSKEKMKKFENCLNKASNIDEPLIRGAVGISCFLESNKEITE